MQLLCAQKGQAEDNTSGRIIAKSGQSRWGETLNDNATSICLAHAASRSANSKSKRLTRSNRLNPAITLIPVGFLSLHIFHARFPFPSSSARSSSRWCQVKLRLSCELRSYYLPFARQASTTYETLIIRLATWTSTKSSGRLHSLLALPALPVLSASTLAPDGDRTGSAIYLKALAL